MANNNNNYDTITLGVAHVVHKSIYGDDWRTVPDNKVKKNNNFFFGSKNQGRDKNDHVVEVKSFKQLEQQRDYFLYKDEKTQ